MAGPTVSIESRIQSFVHALEQGRLALVVRSILVVAIILAVALVCLGWKFRGFADPVAMDQAQIARQIARGNGWSTQFIRPLALWQIEKNLGTLPKAGESFPDTYNAPLGPLVNSLAVKAASNGEMKFGRGEFIAPAERFIAALSMILFLASIGVEYLLLRRLFDSRLAFWASALTLVCDVCWQFTLSGLPQMLMLLIFNGALYALVRAIEINRGIEVLTGEALASTEATAITPEQGQVAGAHTGGVMFWLAAAGVLFGLLALTHALTIWIFAAALLYCGVAFRRRGPVVLVMLLAFAVLYAPWVVRTYRVSGAPFGTAGYALLEGLNGTTATHLRSAHDPGSAEIELRFFRDKIQDGIVTQLEGLTGSLGNDVIAIAFFLCLLHSFRRQEVNAMRSAVLLMWFFAVFGMALLGPEGTTVPAAVGSDQIGILFLPIMLGFGLAYILVLFSRRESSTSLVPRIFLFAGLFLVSALPLVFTMLPRNTPYVQFPPYLESAINLLKTWTDDKEVIASDMPWAVAWYAERDSLWLPTKYADLLGLSDNAKLPGRLVGVFLTPVSRGSSFYFGIYRGEYSEPEYQQLIFGRKELTLFPFQYGYSMLGDLSYTFYSDRPRWEHDIDAPTQ